MPDDGRAPLDVLRRIQRRRLQLRGELAVLVVSIREAFGRLPNEHVYEELFLSGSVEQLEAGLAELQPWRERLQEQHEHPPDGRVENRGRRRIEPVDLPVPRIARMMVDVDGEVAIEPGDARACVVAALHDDRGVEVALHGGRDPDVAHAGKCHELRRRRIEIDHGDVLAERPQRERHRELRSD